MNIGKFGFIFSFLWFINFFSFSQAPRTYHAGELLLEIKKLQVIGSALYVAAHPDDENTAMIAYLGNDRLVRTGYLSLTRGDGGQNLIGAEQDNLLGLIRTQELLQARKIDGGEQMFTRADDFGFSKNAQESYEIWGKEAVLADVVWAIRKFRPDVIITRFPPNRDAGHGHHEASCLLALEAFNWANDPQKFPEQLKYVQPWQPKRIVWNSYSRGFRNQPPDTAKYVKAEIGSYNPLLGKSHLVIAAESRSMHKSQGFGSAKPHGSRTDFLTHFKGEVAENEILSGIDLTWKRLKGTEEISRVLQQAYQQFKPEKPDQIVPILLQAQKLINQFKTQDYETKFWLNLKSEQLKNIIGGCMGLWLEGNARDYAVAKGDSLEIYLEMAKNAETPMTIQSINVLSLKNGSLCLVDSLPKELKSGELFLTREKIVIPKNEDDTQPYWLRKPTVKGLFQVEPMGMIGLPENPAPIQVAFTVKIGEEVFVFNRPITYKWTKPDEGELYRNLEIMPEVMANLPEPVFMFADDKPQNIKITLKAGQTNAKGEVKLELPNNWKVEPTGQSFQLAKKEQELDLIFQITPPKNAQNGQLKVLLKTDRSPNFQLAQGIRRINYPHIPIQTLFPEASAKISKLEVKLSSNKNIGYIEGAGDDIPAHLRQLGYQVEMLKNGQIKGDLSKYEAIIVGIRAYNTEEWLKFAQDKLMEYVKNGGIIVVQYHTNQRLVSPNLGPYPFKIGRERVTVETAPVKFLNPQHPILNIPNKITEKDFEAWIQERGLYFAEDWDKNYQTILAANDPNEKELAGGLLYAEYGKGRFIYTGYAFFRQIPAGVEGAYRLLVNMISK
jgi:LmbE family N-acetylglucosaminyl deacetylase